MGMIEMKAVDGEKEVVVYNGAGNVKIEVLTANDTVWLNRQQLAVLFGRDVKTIGKHIANALKEELKGMATVAKFATVQNRRRIGFGGDDDISTRPYGKKLISRGKG